MRRWFRRLLAVGVAGGLGLMVVAYIATEAALSARYALPAVALPSEPAAGIAGGRAVVERLGCGRCHGEALAGKVLVSGWAEGEIVAPNLTPGLHSVTRAYSPHDWARAIRYALGRDGRGLVTMPLSECNDPDLAAAIAFLSALEPVVGEPPRARPGLLMRLRHLVGAEPLIAAETARLPRQGAIEER